MQDKGIVTRSIRFLIEHWFKQTPLSKTEIKCAVDNIKSKKIPRSLGFTLSHIEEKGELLISGNLVDLEVYVYKN